MLIVSLLTWKFQVELPRLSKVIKNRGNPQTQTAEVYFRITLFISFLDNLLCDLLSRFNEG